MSSHPREDDHQEELIPPNLQPDAAWKSIQQNTFTRWVNVHLSKANTNIGNLETDLADGLKLIALVEVLAQRPVGRYNKKVSFRTQKLENVTMALSFLQNEEAIKIVNIDSSHIVDQNRKLILGLIWTLILHYSISMHRWEDQSKESGSQSASQPEQTPKQRLLKWVRDKLPSDVPVTNFTSDWNDGVAIGALVDSMGPGLCPDWREWEPQGALPNTKKAMQFAENQLGVAPLITPEELLNPNIDEKSVMTYLAQFPQAVYTPLAPAAGLSEIEVSPTVGFPTEFAIHVPGNDVRPKLSIVDADGSDVHHVVERKNAELYTCKYTPEKAGDITIALFVTDIATGETKKVDGTDAHVIAEEGARLRAYDAQCHPGDERTFVVENAGEGPVEMVVVDAHGAEHRPAVVGLSEPGVYMGEYSPSSLGLHSVNVFYRKRHVPGSPFPLRAEPRVINDFAVWGRGVAPAGVRISDGKAPVYVRPLKKGAKTDKVDVTVTGANGPIEVDGFALSEGGLAFLYPLPSKEDVLEVAVTADGVPVAQSPYKVEVSPPTECAVRAFGPGLEGGVAEQVQQFYVETNGDADGLTFFVEGPSKAELSFIDTGAGKSTVEYVANEPGPYRVDILSRGEHIKQSPFVFYIEEKDASLRPSAVRVEGLDSKTQVPVGEKLAWKVDTSNAGDNIYPVVTVRDSKREVVSGMVSPSSHRKGVYDCEFVPRTTGDYLVDVTVCGVAVPGSPYPVEVREATDPSLVRMYGPGVDGPVTSRQPTYFTIDAKQAGPGAVEVALADRRGRAVDIDVLDNQDGSFTVKYTAPRPGPYQLNVVFAGEELPKIEINVKPHMDVSGIRVEGLENGEDVQLIGSRMDIAVQPGKEAHQHAQQGDVVEVFATQPDGKQYILPLEEKADGSVVALFTPSQPGDVKIEVYYAGLLVSERLLRVEPGQDPSRVVASGSALKNGAVVGQPNTLYFDGRAAGNGSLSLQIEGPGEAKTAVRENSDGVCEIDFTPCVPGEYTLSMLYGDKKKHIPGSPFTVVADYIRDPSAIRILPLGESAKETRIGEEIIVEIDAEKTAVGEVTARLPKGHAQPEVVLVDRATRRYVIRFTPDGKPGDELPLHIYYDGAELNDSPVVLRPLPETQPERVRVLGYDGEAAPEKIHACKDVHLKVDCTSAGRIRTVKAEVTGPDGEQRAFTLDESAEARGVFDLRFRTDLAGDYHAMVWVNGVRLADKLTVAAETLHEHVEGSGVEAHEEGETVDATQWAIDVERLVRVRRRRDAPQVIVLAEKPDTISYSITEVVSGEWAIDEVRLRPLAPGTHRVRLVLAGRVIEGGELTFEALSESALYELARSRELEQLEREKAVEQLKREKAMEQMEREKAVEQYEKQYLVEEARREKEVETVEEYSQLRRETELEGKPILREPRQTQTESDDDKALYERRFNFNLPSQFDVSRLSARVVMPSLKKSSAQVVDNHDGTVSVKYTPTESGPHELSIMHNGALLQGTPMKFFVDTYNTGYATVYGSGLQSAQVGEPAAFTVVAKGAQAKELAVSIEGAAQAAIKIHDNKDGTCSVTWVPPVPGEYKVHVKLGGHEVAQSPFSVAVAGSAQKRSHLSVGSTSEVALNIAQTELKGISASIKSPSGIEEPCFVRLLDGGRLGVSFTPREAGEHLITVKRDGKLVPRAPFKIKVDKSQVGDASKVEVSGSGKAKAVTQQNNEILVDTSKAGFGGLSVSVQGPSKAELSCKEVKPGLIQVNYKPTEPGIYAITIKFADHHVKGSPLTVVCSGASSGAIRQEVSKKAEQQHQALPNQDAIMFLKMPMTSAMDLEARMMDPKGVCADVEMRDTGDSMYQIKFHPTMDGVHNLSVLHRGAHVYGSPFQFTVGPFAEGGAHKVRVSGNGVVRGETQNPQTFNIYTREAGGGNLAVSIEGPSKADIKFEDHSDGNCHVAYKVAEPGEYNLSVKFNDDHVPDSPFKVYIAAATGEVRRLELAQFHDTGIPVGKAFTFSILTHRARGHLEAKVHCPSNEVETLDIVPIEEGETYATRFIPKEAGNHYVHITLDGAPMRESPFRLRVGGKDESDPAAIHADGDGLRKGETGHKCEFVVHTTNAGAGVMTIQVDGPSKATLDAYELDTGYKARFTPLAPGDYYTAIKYNGVHIPGSPFKCVVSGKTMGGNGYNETSLVKIDAVAKTSKGTVAVAPTYTGDASKVTAKGAGLNKFFPGRPAMFTIDTGLAGANLLMVGVVTTKGPCEEVLVKHQGNGHYVVNYRIPDRVKGFIFIRYGDEQIPGSPFAIAP